MRVGIVRAPRPTRRQLLQGLLTAVALVRADFPGVAYGETDRLPSVPTVDSTLQAFADTLIPGEKRFPNDRVVAGAADGAGAVQAGVLELLHMPEAGTEPSLPAFANALNAEAAAYAARHSLILDPTVPAMVALPFDARTALSRELMDPAHRDQQAWLLLVLMAFLAFHTAAFEHTGEALRRGHPGLRRLRFPEPDHDGLYRYPHFSYRRRLAESHPRTTKGGNPQ